MFAGLNRLANAFGWTAVQDSHDQPQKNEAPPRGHLDHAAAALERDHVGAAGRHLRAIKFTPKLLQSPEVCSVFRAMNARMVRIGQAYPHKADSACRKAREAMIRAKSCGMSNLSFGILAACVAHYDVLKERADAAERKEVLSEFINTWAESAQMRPAETLDWTRYMLDGMRNSDKKSIAREMRRLLRDFRTQSDGGQLLVSSVTDCLEYLRGA